MIPPNTKEQQAKFDRMEVLLDKILGGSTDIVEMQELVSLTWFLGGDTRMASVRQHIITYRILTQAAAKEKKLRKIREELDDVRDEVRRSRAMSEQFAGDSPIIHRSGMDQAAASNTP